MNLSDKLGNPVAVEREGNAFHLRYGDGDAAGHTDFRDHDGERIFYHTEIDDTYRGRGLAAVLVGAALTATAAEKLPVVAVCPFVTAHLEKDPGQLEWRRPRPADLTWLREHLDR